MKRTIASSLTLLAINLLLVGCSTNKNDQKKDTSSKNAKSEKIASSKKAASESKAKESSKKKAESESKAKAESESKAKAESESQAASIAESQSIANSQAEANSAAEQSKSQAEIQSQEQANAHQTDDGSNEQRSVIDNNSDGVPDGMDPDEYAQDEGYDSYYDMPQYKKGRNGGGNAAKYQDAIDQGLIDENGNETGKIPDYMK